MRNEIAVLVLLLAAAPVAAQPGTGPSTGPSHAHVAGVGYKILSEDGGAERPSVAVRLAARASEAELRRLAEEIAQRRGKGAARITIRFYLDGMALDGAPWAQATTALETRVAISGLKLEEEQLFRAELAQDRRQLVGAWLTSPPAVPGRLVIFRDGARLYAEWRLRSGLKTVDEVTETRVSRGRRYDIKGESTGHFVVTAAGELELRDGDRLMAVAERLRPERAPAVPHGTPAAAVAQPAGAPQTGGQTGGSTGAGAAAMGLGVGSGAPVAAGPGAGASAGLPAMARTAVPGRAGEVAPAEAEARNEAPVTAAAPKAAPRKRAARPHAAPAVKSAVRDAGPIMRLQGQ